MIPFDEAKKLEKNLCKEALFTSTDTPQHNAIRAKIRRLYLKAAKEGSVAALSRAAVCFAYCIGGPPDPVQHKIFVNAAADAGDAVALGMRAENYWFGENGFPVDFERCEADAQQAYLAGAWLGTTVYTWILRKRAEMTQNLLFNKQANEMCKETLPILMEEAQHGDSIAQDWLAWRYYNGEGVAKDPATAAAWFRLSADHGLAWAQYWLGMRYQQGDGVVQDLDAAKHWLKKAAAQGLQDALDQLTSFVVAQT